MKPKDFAAFDDRIRAKAQEMWHTAGRPDGGPEQFLEQARALLEIYENPTAGQIDPDKAARPRIDTLVEVENQGEFPGLTDQGDDQLFPDEQETVAVPIPDKNR